MSCLDTNFLEIKAHALLKVATKGSFRGKKSKNLIFLDYLSEATTECDEKDWSVYHRLGITIPLSTTCFLEGSCDLFKVATKVLFRGIKPVKIEIFRLLFYSRNGGMPPRRLECLR